MAFLKVIPNNSPTLTQEEIEQKAKKFAEERGLKQYSIVRIPDSISVEDLANLDSATSNASKKPS